MIYRIENIKIKPGDDKAFLREKIAKKLRLETDDIKDVTIIRESVDARQRGNIMRVFTLDFSCSKKLKLKKGGRPVYFLSAEAGTNNLLKHYFPLLPINSPHS